MEGRVDSTIDRQVRQFCLSNGMIYQGFSLLTANRSVVGSPELARIAKRYDRWPEQVIFRFAIQLGMLPLTGTTKAAHMRADLDVDQFSLAQAEVALIENLLTR